MTSPLSDDALGLVARRFKALSDPSRLRILNVLMQDEASVGELVERTGLGQSNVSRHLALLRDEGIVERRTEGQWAYYSLGDPTIRQLCELVCGGLGDQLARRARKLRS